MEIDIMTLFPEAVDAMLGMAAPPPDAVQRREETEYYQYNPGAK